MRLCPNRLNMWLLLFKALTHTDRHIELYIYIYIYMDARTHETLARTVWRSLSPRTLWKEQLPLCTCMYYGILLWKDLRALNKASRSWWWSSARSSIETERDVYSAKEIEPQIEEVLACSMPTFPGALLWSDRSGCMRPN